MAKAAPLAFNYIPFLGPSYRMELATSAAAVGRPSVGRRYLQSTASRNACTPLPMVFQSEFCGHNSGGGGGGGRGSGNRSDRGHGGDEFSNYTISLPLPVALRKRLTAANAFAGFFGWTVASLFDSARVAPLDYDDFRAAAAWGVFGLLFHGVIGTFYYALLDDVVSGSTAVPVALKTLVDVCAFFPLLAALHEAYSRQIQKNGTRSVRHAMRGRSFSSGTILREPWIWVPAQLINFACLPTYWRVAWVNIVLAVSSLFQLLVDQG